MQRNILTNIITILLVTVQVTDTLAGAPAGGGAAPAAGGEEKEDSCFGAVEAECILKESKQKLTETQKTLINITTKAKNQIVEVEKNLEKVAALDELKHYTVEEKRKLEKAIQDLKDLIDTTNTDIDLPKTKDEIDAKVKELQDQIDKYSKYESPETSSGKLEALNTAKDEVQTTYDTRQQLITTDIPDALANGIKELRRTEANKLNKKELQLSIDINITNDDETTSNISYTGEEIIEMLKNAIKNLINGSIIPDPPLGGVINTLDNDRIQNALDSLQDAIDLADQLNRLVAEFRLADRRSKEIAGYFKKSQLVSICKGIYGEENPSKEALVCKVAEKGLFTFITEKIQELNSKTKKYNNLPNEFNNPTSPMQPFARTASQKSPNQSILRNIYTQKTPHIGNFDNVMNRLEITNLFLQNILYPYYITSTNDTYYKPIKNRSIYDQRFHKKFKLSTLTCQKALSNEKNPVKYINKKTFCEMLKPENFAIIKRIAQLQSYLHVLKESINGCQSVGLSSELKEIVGKDKKEREEKIEKFKKNHDHIIRVQAILPQPGKPKFRHFEPKCITKWSGDANLSAMHGSYNPKSSINGFYIFAESLLDFLDEVGEFDAYTIKIKNKKIQQKFDKIKAQLTSIKMIKLILLPFMSSLESSNITPSVANNVFKILQSQIEPLEDSLNALLLDVLNHVYDKSNHPGFTTIANILNTSNYHQERPKPPKVPKVPTLTCNGSISFDNLVASSATSFTSKENHYELLSIKNLLSQIAEVDKAPPLTSVKVSSSSNEPNIFSGSKLKKSQRQAMAAGLGFKINEETNKSEKFNEQVISAKEKKDLLKYFQHQHVTTKRISKEKYDESIDKYFYGKSFSLSALYNIYLSRFVQYKFTCNEGGAKRTYTATPMDILKHNATYRVENDKWFDELTHAQGSAEILKEINFLLADERSMSALIRKQKEKIAALSSMWLISNKSNDSATIESLASSIREKMNTHLKGHDHKNSTAGSL